MYKTFRLFAILSTSLSILFVIGMRYQIEVLLSSTFYSLSGVYFLITFVALLILLLRDHKLIFIKTHAFKNTLLYLLTTPLPLLLALVLPHYLKQNNNSYYLQKKLSDFNLCSNCLKELDSVEVIHSSAGPEYNPGLNFYYHALVVANAGRDTFNILSTSKVIVNSGNRKRYYSLTMLKILENHPIAPLATNIQDLEQKHIQTVVLGMDKELGESYLRYKTVLGELVISAKSN